MGEALYDPIAPDFQLRIYEIYRELRDHHPVYHDPDREFFTLTRFADVWAAVNDPATFANSGVIEAESLLPQLVYMDPPRHDDMRALVSRAFTPKRIADLEPRARHVAAALAAKVFSERSVELVHDYAAPLPATLISEMIGVDEQYRDAFREWTQRFIEIESPDDFGDAATNCYGLFAKLLAERRVEPHDDLMTALINAELDGQQLSDEEIQGFCFQLIIAGNDTTATLIGTGAKLLAEHPEARADLVAEPGLIPGAVEEMLRLETPAQVLPRTTTTEVEMHGVRIPAGARVMMVWGAANHDEREFPDAERFDIHRRFSRHLALGHGVHFCLGASLARLDGRIAFEELLRQAPVYELAEEPNWLHSSWARTLGSLKISVP